MPFPANKTKLVCTIGPASDSPAILEEMILAAIRQGLKKSKEMAEEERGKAMGGLNLPGLEGLI